MRAQFVIPVLASILILGTLGLSQDAYAQENTVIDTILVDSAPRSVVQKHYEKD